MQDWLFWHLLLIMQKFLFQAGGGLPPGFKNLKNLVKSNRHEAHYRIFCTPLFLSPPHIKCTPHHPALTNPQSVFFAWRKTPNFTPTQNDRNNVSFIYQYMQHSELKGWKYCLNLSCSFFQDHGPSQILSGFNISWTWLTTKWQWYFTSNVT
jgi:hypothetical protein